MTAPEKPITATATQASLSDCIRPHLKEIADRAAETERQRTVPPENFARIKEAGFVRSLVPKCLGGDERDLWDYCDGVRTITKACPSTGWVAGVLNTKPAAVCQFHPDAQKEVWATGVDTPVCISGSPLMKAKLVDGGVVVSGRAKWASGCDHAEWAIVGMKVPELSDPQYPERGARDYLFLAHRSEYVIDDTWYSMGQRGSGSKDLVFTDHFVPFKRMERSEAVTFGFTQGAGVVDSWFLRIPMPIRFGIWLPAIGLGCADGMIEQFTHRQRTRKNAYTGAPGILNPAGHMRLAESVHELESLTAFYRELLYELQALGERGGMNEDEFMDMISKFPFIADRAVRVIDRLFDGSGASAIADFNVMQRYWRDGHTARLHQAMDYDYFKQTQGRNLMGLMPTMEL